MMRFEEKGEGSAACSQALRTLDVILLRDNRQSIRSPDFRSSAFKGVPLHTQRPRLTRSMSTLNFPIQWNNSS